MPDLMDAVMQNNRQVAGNIEAWGQLYDNAKVADAMVKANPDLPQRMGFQDAKHFATLSAMDKIAATTGYIKQQGVQEFQTRQQEMLARIAEYQAVSQHLTRQNASEDAFEQSWRRAGAARAADTLNQGAVPRAIMPVGWDEWAAEAQKNPAAFNAPGAATYFQQMAKTAAGSGRAGTVTEIPGLPGRKFVWQTDRSGSPVETGASSEIPPKPTVPPEPGFAWRWNGKDWQMAQTMPGNLPPATASRLDSLTAQEQSILTEMSTPYKPGWFDEKPEARTKRLEAALKGIQTRKALLLDPRGGSAAEAGSGPRRYNPETGLIE